MKNKSPNTQLSMTLKDGRQLGFAEYGSPDGKPIFFFHGLPGCRLDASHFHKVALSNHYRLIGIDRPGMGLSTINENRSILSWADDVEEFANQKIHASVFQKLHDTIGNPHHQFCEINYLATTCLGFR